MAHFGDGNQGTYEVTTAEEDLPAGQQFNDQSFDALITVYQYEDIILNGNTLKVGDRQDDKEIHVVLVNGVLDLGDGGSVEPRSGRLTGNGTGGAGGGSGGDGGDGGVPGPSVIIYAREIKGSNGARILCDGSNGANGADAATGSSGAGNNGNDGFDGIHLRSRQSFNDGGGFGGTGGDAGTVGQGKGGGRSLLDALDALPQGYITQAGRPGESGWAHTHRSSGGAGGGGGGGSTGTLSQAGGGGGGGGGGAYGADPDDPDTSGQGGVGGDAGSISGNDEEGYGGGGGGGGSPGGFLQVVTNFLNIDVASDLKLLARGGDGGAGGDGATNGSGGGGGGGGTGGYVLGFGFTASDVTVDVSGGAGGAGGLGAGNGGDGSAGDGGDKGFSKFTDEYPTWVENLNATPSFRADKIENRPAATEVPPGSVWVATDVNRIYRREGNSWVIKGEENDDAGGAFGIESSEGVRAVGEAENVGGDTDEGLETDKSTRGTSSAGTQAQTLLGDKYADDEYTYEITRLNDPTEYEVGSKVKHDGLGIEGTVRDVKRDGEDVTLIVGVREDTLGEDADDVRDRVTKEERA